MHLSIRSFQISNMHKKSWIPIGRFGMMRSMGKANRDESDKPLAPGETSGIESPRSLSEIDFVVFRINNLERFDCL
jgi:hypothetical protein